MCARVDLTQWVASLFSPSMAHPPQIAALRTRDSAHRDPWLTTPRACRTSYAPRQRTHRSYTARRTRRRMACRSNDKLASEEFLSGSSRLCFIRLEAELTHMLADRGVDDGWVEGGQGDEGSRVAPRVSHALADLKTCQKW